jgi:hypothetical protein
VKTHLTAIHFHADDAVDLVRTEQVTVFSITETAFGAVFTTCLTAMPASESQSSEAMGKACPKRRNGAMPKSTRSRLKPTGGAKTLARRVAMTFRTG